MGTYFKVFNLTKKEMINPWDCGGLGKKREIIANLPGLPAVLTNLMLGSWKGDHVVMIGDSTEEYGELSEKFKDITLEAVIDYNSWFVGDLVNDPVFVSKYLIIPDGNANKEVILALEAELEYYRRYFATHTSSRWWDLPTEIPDWLGEVTP